MSQHDGEKGATPTPPSVDGVADAPAREAIAPAPTPDSSPESSGLKPPATSQPKMAQRVPLALQSTSEFIWDDDQAPVENYKALGQQLAGVGDLYRDGAHGNALLLVPEDASTPIRKINKAPNLAQVLADRLRVRVSKKGNTTSRQVAAKQLGIMLGSDAFLQEFAVVDTVTRVPMYLPSFRLTKPGYNDGGLGQHIYYRGPAIEIADSLERIPAFLDAMDFAGNADRTNTAGAALTVLLRNFWPGGKPVIAVTATKSHAGKATVLQFACGLTPSLSVSYDREDWALEQNVCAEHAKQPESGVIVVENARLARREPFIASAFVERTVTSVSITLYCTGKGNPNPRNNDLIFAISTNEGTLSTDLLNRALPIHLAPTGNIEDRMPSIGNPKYDFLPTYRNRIQAELHFMIQRWIEEGMPRDDKVKHPFGPWAQMIGGILMVNGFVDFLANFSIRKGTDDLVRKALGILGCAKPDEWLRPGELADLAVRQSLTQTLIRSADRHTEAGRERGIGETLSQHKDETFVCETENGPKTLRLRRRRRRLGSGAEAKVCYKFETIAHDVLPDDLIDEQSGAVSPDEPQANTQSEPEAA
jgi:hypothetical protein